MAQRTDNTMVEFLQKLLKDIATAKLLPDADGGFLVSLENMIIEEAKKPVNNLRDQGVLPPAGGQPGTAPPMGSMSGMGMAGAGASDEMRRMLQPAQGPQ